MLLNLNTLGGHKLAATDGEIGHVKDFYFDDKTWAIRYLEVDTGSWLSGRRVLLSPHAFSHFDLKTETLHLKLTKQQIENSPSIDAHRPVSRQYEENYYNYYGWPVYWEGGSDWGTGDYPVFATSSRDYASKSYNYPTWDDIHLQSAKSLVGQDIHASDGDIGKVSGVLVDDKRWIIRELAVETGHWYSGKEIMIAPSKIQRISYPESKVFVSLTKGEIERTPKDALAHAGT
jgi:uncharacterized protein YrrD